MQPSSPKAYSINDFVNWNNREEIFLSPKYQRRAVWSEKAKSYLIDTIIRGFPIPKIFIRQHLDLSTRKSTREIVDGQQRLRTILSYVADGFKLLKAHNEEFGGLFFSELPGDIQVRILNYEISADLLNDASDPEILELFARINTYTVTLNKQELLNSKYFGAFKSTVYRLGYEFSNFWIKNKILTDKEISRMGEAEFASELTIALIDGIQDKKTVEDYYIKYDDSFPKSKEIKKTFRENIDVISELFSGNLSNSYFSSRPLFSSLFLLINTLREADNLKKNKYSKIYNGLAEIDSFLENPPKRMGRKDLKFYDACTKHVTDLDARKIRHETLLTAVNKKIK